MINNFMHGVKQRYNEYTKPSEPTEPTDLPSLLKSSTSLMIYPNQAQFYTSFVAGSKEIPSDVNFITERDPYFFDKNLITLADGKPIEVKPGEIYMPFTALTKSNKEINFYLPGNLVYKMRKEGEVTLLIGEEKVQVYLCKYDDYRLPELQVGSKIEVYSIDNSIVPTIFKMLTKKLITDQVKILTDKQIGTKRLAYASTPVCVVNMKMPDGPLYEIGNWKEQATELMKDVSVDQKLTVLKNKENLVDEYHADVEGKLIKASPEDRTSLAQISNFEYSNCEVSSPWNVSKKTDGSFLVEAKFSVPSEDNTPLLNRILDFNGESFINLYEDQLVVVKNYGTLKPNYTVVEGGIADNSVTIFEFQKYGITLMQMQAAIERGFAYKNGLATFFISALNENKEIAENV